MKRLRLFIATLLVGGLLGGISTVATVATAADGLVNLQISNNVVLLRVDGDKDDDWWMQGSTDLTTWTTLTDFGTLLSANETNAPWRAAGTTTDELRHFRAVQTKGLYDPSLFRTISITYTQGTYAYFTTLDANGQPAFPYAIGRQWYGNVTGGAVTTIAEAVTTNFTAWTTNSTNLTATGNTGRYTNSDVGDLGFYKVMLTAVADYDPVIGATTGGGRAISTVSPTTGARGTTSTLTITLPNTAPPANAPILSVSVGNILGTGNVHVSQTRVTSTITIPANAATGAQTVTVVFPGPPQNQGTTETYTLANGFTIN